MERKSIMKTLYLERSTLSCRDGKWVNSLDLAGIERIVVGIGPGSFAGIRSALAFAQGYRLGSKCEVLGLPSPCAVIGALMPSEVAKGKIAVVGDARQGKFWIALFVGGELEREIFQVEGAAALAMAVASDYRVVSSDDARIGEVLRDSFSDRYLGLRLPTDDGLKAYVEAGLGSLRPEPLPLYLNPAVR